MSDTLDFEDGSRTIGEALQLDGSRSFFGLAGRLFAALGFDTAAENLRRYRSGEGGTQTYSSAEIDRHPAFAAAEDANRTRFESRTFTGGTGRAGTVRGLADGETTSFSDFWQKSINGLGSNWEPPIISRPSTYFAFGRTGTQSSGQFEATRQGDDVIITGTVTHGLYGPNRSDSEVFDFNPGQIGHEQATALESAGEAAPFGMRYQRSQDVSARLRRADDGSLTLRSATWGALR